MRKQNLNYLAGLVLIAFIGACGNLTGGNTQKASTSLSAADDFNGLVLQRMIVLVRQFVFPAEAVS